MQKNSDPRRFCQSIRIKDAEKEKHEPTNHEITGRLRFCLLNWQETNFIQFEPNRTDEQYRIKIIPERTSPLFKIECRNNRSLTIFRIYFPFAVTKTRDPFDYLKASFWTWKSVLSEKTRQWDFRFWPRPPNPDHYFGYTRLIGILSFTIRSFHLALCSIPGQIIGTSVYFFFLRLPYCPDIVYIIGYVKMVYCGSVRIKLGVYTSGIFCFELPKWIKWNKKLLFIK